MIPVCVYLHKAMITIALCVFSECHNYKHNAYPVVGATRYPSQRSVKEHTLFGGSARPSCAACCHCLGITPGFIQHGPLIPNFSLSTKASILRVLLQSPIGNLQNSWSSLEAPTTILRSSSKAQKTGIPETVFFGIRMFIIVSLGLLSCVLFLVWVRLEVLAAHSYSGYVRIPGTGSMAGSSYMFL